MKNAFTYRNVLCGGALYAALGFVQIASAGFASPSPPSGFSNTPDGPAYRGGQWVNGTARSFSDLVVSGRRVQVPVELRVAANAPLYAARFLFRHPVLAAASILAPIGLEFINGQWNQVTAPNYPVSDGYVWGSSTPGFGAGVPGQTPHQACLSVGAQPNYIVTCTLVAQTPTSKTFHHRGHWYNEPPPVWYTIVTYQKFPNHNCPAGWSITPAGCVQTAQPVTRPLTEEEFVPLVAPRISPAQVPDILPDHVPIPVERPVTVPLTVPLSDPVPIPNTAPQEWRQPLVQVSPSPTASDPFRVSLNQVERITTSPYGITEPVASVDPAARPSPYSDFCIRNPGILACAPVPVLDVPADQIPTATALITYQPEHFLGGGSCPRPVTVNLAGTTIVAFDTPVYCQFISSYFRPVLLAIAAFTSMMIVAGGFRSV